MVGMHWHQCVKIYINDIPFLIGGIYLLLLVSVWIIYQETSIQKERYKKDNEKGNGYVKEKYVFQ